MDLARILVVQTIAGPALANNARQNAAEGTDPLAGVLLFFWDPAGRSDMVAL